MGGNGNQKTSNVNPKEANRKEGHNYPIKGFGNGNQKRRIKGESVGAEQKGSGNGSQKRRIKREAIITK